MSIAATIFDSLITLASGSLTGYTELPDRITTEANSELMLVKGFAVVYGDEINENRILCNILTLERSFSLILSNAMTTTEHNTEARKTLEKNIIEDAYTFIKALMNDNTLGGVAVDASYESQSAIEYLVDQDDNESFLVLSLDITVKYQEQY